MNTNTTDPELIKDTIQRYEKKVAPVREILKAFSIHAKNKIVDKKISEYIESFKREIICIESETISPPKSKPYKRYEKSELAKIVERREEGASFSQIADECGRATGKAIEVKYNKFMAKKKKLEE